MATEAEQLDDLLRFVYPDEEIVVFNVTLHASGIVAGEHVGAIVFGNGTRVSQQFQYSFHIGNATWIVLDALQVLLETAGHFQRLHEVKAKLQNP